MTDEPSIEPLKRLIEVAEKSDETDKTKTLQTDVRHFVFFLLIVVVPVVFENTVEMPHRYFGFSP